MRRAVEQDPLSVMWRGVLMGHLVNAGRYEEALQEGGKRSTSRRLRFTRF